MTTAPAKPLLDEPAPAPLATFTHTVISPENIALEQRKERAVVLSRRQQRDMRRQIKTIEKQLHDADYSTLRFLYSQLKSQLEPLQERWNTLTAQLKESPDSDVVKAALELLKSEVEEPYQKWLQLKHQLRRLHPLWVERRNMLQVLEDQSLARERMKVERKQADELKRELRIYEQLIIACWNRLGFKHEFEKKGKRKIKSVKFSRRVVTLDAIYFQIDTGYKAISGKWFDNMPEGVYVAKHLLSEDTLMELSITCRHQVTGIYDKSGNSGAWVIVHRLESVDGLMNYVHYNDVMQRYPFQHKKRLPIPVGVAHNREVQWATLKDLPHWLIAGYTGSGKSNLVNVGICSLLSTQSPDDLRLVLIDLKGGMEFDTYRDIPHLHGGIISEVDAVETMLADIVAVLYYRMKVIRGTAKDIDVYRQRRPNEYMPRILLVFDEVASIGDHGQTTKRILQYLTLIGRLGRALGIHSWLCTQRPDTNVLTGAVKANMNPRISGRMSTASDSITVLGNGSAATLAAVEGRMIWMRGPDPMPIQTPHITEDAIFASIEKARNYPTPPDIPIPERKVVDVVWTPEKIIELSLDHLGGKITWKAVYEAADDLSQSQARELVKSIWQMDCIQFQGKQYKVVTGRSNTRYLEEIPPTTG